MDFTVILLIFILIVIIYLFYVYFIASSSKIVNSVNLNILNTPTTTNNSPTITNFSVDFWIYINSWNTDIAKNIITLKKSNGSAKIMSVDLDASSPKLTTSVNVSGSTQPPSITITNNFPVQKWVYVIVSISNNLVDCYLDGRLVSSYQISGGTTIDASNATGIEISYCNNGQTFDAYLYNLNRNLYPMDTDTAQRNYYYGAPSAAGGTNYNVNFSVTKSGSPVASYSLF